ncbi:hypothetical protein [Nitrosovibrio tenuis]|nr:hypothetical protein [Nitrosovibrio tenuis]
MQNELIAPGIITPARQSGCHSSATSAAVPTVGTSLSCIHWPMLLREVID